MILRRCVVTRDREYRADGNRRALQVLSLGFGEVHGYAPPSKVTIAETTPELPATCGLTRI